MRPAPLIIVLGASLALGGCVTLDSSAPADSGSVVGLDVAPVASRGEPTGDGPLSGRTVVVDAGHAGVWTKEDSGRLVTTYGDKKVPCYTAGAIAPDGTGEHTLNFDLAKRVATRLRASGATVVMTRADDDSLGPCNDARGKLANTTHADALVALHADSDSEDKRGFHLIYSPEMHGGDATQAASVALATSVSDALQRSPLPPANYKGTPELPIDPRTNIAALNELTAAPGILVEVGNLNNPDDWALLARPRTREALAQGIADGLTDHLGQS